MSFWRRLFGGEKGDDDDPVQRADPVERAPRHAEPPRRERPDTARAIVEAATASDALRALRSAVGGRDERAALAAVATLHEQGEADDELLLCAAEVHVQRGEPDAALALLVGASSVSAWMLTADLHAERGEWARAVSYVERVLVRDIDAPGARERHRRWRGRLGDRGPELPQSSHEATVMRSRAPATHLRIVGEAGRGGAGTVWEAVDEALSRRVAFKVYHRPEADRGKLENEARVAVELAGSGVVRIWDADPDAGWIAMEWVGGGSLSAAIARGDDSLLLPLEGWVLPLLRAARRVHRSGLCHGDIKPANVLMRGPGEPVMSDFGLSRAPDRVAPGGSLGYVSPERLEDSRVSVADDIYALGRIVQVALDAVGPDDARWRRLVSSALAPRERRPSSVDDLCKLLPGPIA